jgi:hypothetical protein
MGYHYVRGNNGAGRDQGPIRGGERMLTKGHQDTVAEGCGERATVLGA